MRPFKADKQPRHVTSWGLFIVIALLFGACSPADNPGAPVVEQSLTPTPFQPQNGPSGSFFESWAPPTQSLPSAPLATPTIILEGGGYMSTIYPTLVGALPYAVPAGINPLTGLPPLSPKLLERRPIAVKVTNFPRYVRPQSGLTRADVVFEYYIEDGCTRFIAVFYGNDAERAGPIRSGRFFDEHILRMYHAYLIFKYADDRVEKRLHEPDLKTYLITPGDYSCPPLCQGSNTIDSYNNWFLQTAGLADYVARRGTDNSHQDIRAGFFYSLPPSSDQQAERIFLRYSAYAYSYWEYSPDLHKYARYQEVDSATEGRSESYEVLRDALNGLPVTTDNVIVLFVPYTFANKFDEEDEVYHVDLFRVGEAYVFRDGLALKAYWWRLNVDQPLILTDPAGNLLPLRPGTSFYEVIGKSSSFWREGSDWHFRFVTP